MTKKLFAIALGAMLVSSCAQVSGLINNNSDVTLTVAPKVLDSEFTTQAVPHLYVIGDVATMDIELYSIPSMGAASNSESVMIAKKSLTSNYNAATIKFGSLHHDAYYRIRAKAYHTLDGLISTTDSNSYTDVHVGTDDRPGTVDGSGVIDLKCKLVNIPFNGQSTASGIVLTPSTYSFPVPTAIE
jgi:hypothetical protein